MRNPIAKYSPRVNKPKIFKDKKKDALRKACRRPIANVIWPIGKIGEESSARASGWCAR